MSAIHGGDALGETGRQVGDPGAGERGSKGVVPQGDGDLLIGKLFVAVTLSTVAAGTGL